MASRHNQQFLLFLSKTSGDPRLCPGLELSEGLKEIIEITIQGQETMLKEAPYFVAIEAELFWERSKRHGKF